MFFFLGLVGLSQREVIPEGVHIYNHKDPRNCSGNFHVPKVPCETGRPLVGGTQGTRKGKGEPDPVS